MDRCRSRRRCRGSARPAAPPRCPACRTRDRSAGRSRRDRLRPVPRTRGRSPARAARCPGHATAQRARQPRPLVASRPVQRARVSSTHSTPSPRASACSSASVSGACSARARPATRWTRSAMIVVTPTPPRLVFVVGDHARPGVERQEELGESRGLADVAPEAPHQPAGWRGRPACRTGPRARTSTVSPARTPRSNHSRSPALKPAMCASCACVGSPAGT